MWITLLLFVMVIIFVALYVGWAILSTWLAVKAAPREEMLLCPVHGPIRKSNAIDFMGEPFCSICFHQRLSSAERGRNA